VSIRDCLHNDNDHKVNIRGVMSACVNEYMYILDRPMLGVLYNNIPLLQLLRLTVFTY
jgi:hypothetical protein